MKPTLYILLILLVVSCSKSDPAVPTVEQTVVSFETDYDWTADSSLATRGEAKTGFAAGDEIGILAYYSQNEESIDGLTPNFMYNQLASYQQVNESFAWVYSPVKYWPNNTNDRLQFFAYHPHYTYSSSDEDDDGVKIELSSSSLSGYPTISFRQAIDIGDQVDFMTSQTTQLEKCDNIPLPFSHQLTKVTFAACHNGVSTDQIVVTKLIMTINEAQVALIGTFDDTKFNAETTGDTETLSYVLEGDYLQSGNSALIPTTDDDFYKTVSTDKGALMLLPQTIGENCVTIIATIDIDRGWNEEDEGYVGVKEITLNVPSEHQYVAGESIIYQFTIDLETTELSFDIENIKREAWKEGSEITEDTGDTGGTIW